MCPKCFTDSIEERVERTISRFGMFDFDSRIAVAVSGGKDSLSLLHILTGIESKFPRSKVTAITVDEGVKGYRNKALKLASEACESLGVKHIILSFVDLFGFTMDEIAERIKEEKLTPCSYCGVLRRRALNEAARQIEADRLATAHNLDDMAQSALLNLMRGDTVRLAGMHPAGGELAGFVRRIKPFCEVPERESTLYAYLNGIEFQDSPCPYAEEAMRTDIRNFLNQMEFKRPGTKFIIYRTALKIIPKVRDEDALPGGLCLHCGEPTRGDICRVCELLGALSK